LVSEPKINDLSEHLFQLGHEHEIEDSILDMEFTPNRGDCLSLMGLARDLNVFYETNIKPEIYLGDIPKLNIDFKNNASDICNEISFLKIEIKEPYIQYKDYLENYFKDLKLNKNNFFTDISNYIGYEMGQPTHCYDFSLISDGLILQKNKTECDFLTLTDKNITLDKDDLVFTDKRNEVINLAGIIGGMKTSCSKNTKTVLIECASFKPESIVGKATKYDVHSDASHKFERGVDPLCHENVLRRFIHIVKDHVDILNLEIYQEQNNTFNNTSLDIDLNKINNILGMNVSMQDFSDALKKLGFLVNNQVTVPSYRNDIHHQNDLSEEIARVTGYNNIPSDEIKIKSSQKTSYDMNEEKIKSFLYNNGFAEVINSPFCSSKETETLIVDNPLDSNRQYLRTNIIDSLLENTVYNEKRQKDSIKMFEISDIYSFDKEIKKERKIAIIISGRMGLNYREFSKQLDKHYLMQLFKEINFKIDDHIFQIDRSKINSKIKTPIFFAELQLAELCKNFDDSKIENTKSNAAKFARYVPFSEYPSSSRDLSFSIKDYSKVGELHEVINVLEVRFLKKFFIFDFYENKKTNEVKIGYRFIFQSQNKTLTDEEIDKSINSILKKVLSIETITLPGA
jgi:phenylalanyl-tRNA synthetase beta chain